VRYIKIVLTIIAVLLFANLIKGTLVREPIASGVTNVNIQSVGGATIFGGVLPVKGVK